LILFYKRRMKLHLILAGLCHLSLVLGSPAAEAEADAQLPDSSYPLIPSGQTSRP